MGIKLLTLNFRCFVSWTARKLTNAWVINSVIDICLFQVSITVFKDFSRLFHTYDHFQGFSRPGKFLHQIQGLSIVFQDLYEPCLSTWHSATGSWNLFEEPTFVWHDFWYSAPATSIWNSLPRTVVGSPLRLGLKLRYFTWPITADSNDKMKWNKTAMI